MQGYLVKVKWPSGPEIETKVLPGAPHLWANRGNASPKGEKPRAILSMEDACEYCRRTLHNRLSPVDLEWPESVTPVKDLDISEEEAAAVVKGLTAKKDQ